MPKSLPNPFKRTTLFCSPLLNSIGVYVIHIVVKLPFSNFAEAKRVKSGLKIPLRWLRLRGI